MTRSKYIDYWILRILCTLKILIKTRRLTTVIAYFITAGIILFFTHYLDSTTAMVFNILLSVMFLLLAIMAGSNWKCSLDDLDITDFYQLPNEIGVEIWNEIVDKATISDVSVGIADPQQLMHFIRELGPLKHPYELTNKYALSDFGTDTLVNIFKGITNKSLIGVFTKCYPIWRSEAPLFQGSSAYAVYERACIAYIKTKQSHMSPAQFYIYWHMYLKELKCRTEKI